jgi:hypothetical protein
MYSSQLSQQSPYHNQANEFPYQPEFNNNWTKLSHKHDRSAQDETETKTKHSKENEHWLNQTSTSTCYTALLEEKREDHQQNPVLKPPPINITDVKNILPLTKLLEQTEKQQHEIKALAGNQVKVHPKISEAYGTIVKTWLRNAWNSTPTNLKKKEVTEQC